MTTTDIGPAPEFTAHRRTDASSRIRGRWRSLSEPVAQVDLWRPLLDAVSFFEHARVYLVSGEHPDGDMWRYEAAGRFDALAQMKSGEWRSLHGKHEAELGTPENR